VHAGRAGDDAVGLAQTLDEPRDDDDLAAVAFEESGGLVQPFGRKEDVAAVAFDQAAAAEVAEGEADVVACDSAAEAEQ
jgi:hypothetical protein